MDEQFDKKLTNHIKGVFDNYEHPGAWHGWEQLKKKLPAQQQQNKVAWLWWSSAAAVVIVLIGVGIWFNKPANTADNLAVKPVKKQQPVIDNAQPLTEHTDQSSRPEAADEGALAKNNLPVFTDRALPADSYNAPAVNITSVPNNNGDKNPTNAKQVTVNPVAAYQAQNGQPDQGSMLTTVVDSQKLVPATNNQPQLAATTATKNNSVQQNNTAEVNPAKKQPKTMADMFAEESKNHTSKNNAPVKQEGKKVNFSVYAATYFNYAEGSANQVNAGAGFTSDFRISKNFKLSTGVALAQNSLSYNSQAPQSTSANGLVAMAPALKQETLFATSAVLPVFKNYNASLVGLDIPINIKYEFNPDKTDAYISAGLSSGTFINENYSYKYSYGNGASSANSNVQEEQTAHNSFNNFYFGKMLNLSIGVGTPVGGNRLIIEPFVKYPLGGLGAQDIRFGSGGVNLKFSFKTQKK